MAVLCIALGIVGLVGGGLIAPRRALSAALSNFSLLAGIAQAGVIFAAILFVTGARWDGPLRQMGLRFGTFLPAALGLFALLALAGSRWAGAVEHGRWPAAGVLVRDGAILTLLLGLSRSFDRSLAQSPHRGSGSGRRARVLAPLLLIAYAYGWSWLAFDLLMGLAPEFVSTLFGAFVFIGNLYGALAALALTAALLARAPAGAALAPPQRLHDLGKLLFAFCLLWTYLLFSQILPIWYGNLPHETGYLVDRMTAPWSVWGWIMMLAGFGLPFVLLLGRAGKRRPALLASASVSVLFALWLERSLMVAPALSGAPPWGWIELSVALGSAGAFTLCVGRGPSRSPDPLTDGPM